MMTVIHFEDHGQDFLKWVVDNDNHVVSSFPCQSVWKGAFVHPTTIKEGMKLIVEINDTTKLVRYPVAAIEYMDDDNTLTRQKKSFLELGNKLSEAINFFDLLEALPSEADLAILHQAASFLSHKLAEIAWNESIPK